MTATAIVHLLEPSAIDAAHLRRVRYAYARCGAQVPLAHGRGLRVTCAACNRLEREDDLAIRHLQEETDGTTRLG